MADPIAMPMLRPVREATNALKRIIAETDPPLSALDSDEPLSAVFRSIAEAARVGLSLCDGPTPPIKAKSKSSILLVLPDEQQRSAAAAELLEAGHHVFTAADGRQALAVHEGEQGSIDLLIAAAHLPGMSGIDLARMLTALRPEMKAIIAPGNIGRLAEWAERTLKPEWRSKSLLIADDDERIRRFFKRILEPAGYLVYEAPSGSGAFNLLAEAPMDLLILDLIMPEREGIETLRSVRRQYPEMPVIVVSGADVSCLQAARFLGASEVLHKPIRPEELLTAVETIIRCPKSGHSYSK